MNCVLVKDNEVKTFTNLSHFREIKFKSGGIKRAKCGKMYINLNIKFQLYGDGTVINPGLTMYQFIRDFLIDQMEIQINGKKFFYNNVAETLFSNQNIFFKKDNDDVSHEALNSFELSQIINVLDSQIVVDSDYQQFEPSTCFGQMYSLQLSNQQQQNLFYQNSQHRGIRSKFVVMPINDVSNLAPFIYYQSNIMIPLHKLTGYNELFQSDHTIDIDDIEVKLKTKQVQDFLYYSDDPFSAFINGSADIYFLPLSQQQPGLFQIDIYDSKLIIYQDVDTKPSQPFSDRMLTTNSNSFLPIVQKNFKIEADEVYYVITLMNNDVVYNTNVSPPWFQPILSTYGLYPDIKIILDNETYNLERQDDLQRFYYQHMYQHTQQALQIYIQTNNTLMVNVKGKRNLSIDYSNETEYIVVQKIKMSQITYDGKDLIVK